VRALGSLSISALVLGVVSLFLEQSELSGAWLGAVTSVVDYAVLFLTLAEVTVGVLRAPIKRNYVKQNWPSLLFVLLFVVLFIYNKSITAGGGTASGYLTVLIVRNLFLLLKVFTRLRKLSAFVASVVTHPAQTIVLSFVLVIIIGTLVMMMPFTTVDGHGLPFVDSLFTTTSAVCVTGLIVVDTATAFTTWGQVVILLLIQIGGLGIMILSFFTIFVFRQSVSVENKLLISYLLSESNMTTLSTALRRIIAITFAIELSGAALLYPLTQIQSGSGGVFQALFHAVSAFCNAGFALYSDSLERFVGNVGVNLVIGFLIIAGGLSFSVIANSFSFLGARIRRHPRAHRPPPRLSVNTRVVLIVSATLIVSGSLIIYALEHHRAMAAMPTGIQYLASFFQSTTLRTAGFNSIPMGGLAAATYLVMMAMMFVGGASGSTAGGIKVNTIAVIGAYLRSKRQGRRETVLFKHTVREDQVAAAFTVLVFGVVAVGIATILLSLTDSFTLTETLFESVSAFATVGLSTGITGSLSTGGRVIIVVMMFIGRVGPLTLFSAVSAGPRGVSVSFPAADISVG
jgi:trk system potassium uptake protein TrkH